MIAGATVAAFLFAACANGTPDTPAQPEPTTPGVVAEPGDSPGGAGTVGAAPHGNLRLGSLVSPASWDVNGLNVGHFMTPLTMVFDTLLRWDAEGGVEPGIAESWEYNADRTVLTLHLRPGLTFSDGTALDAEAVAANIDHFRASSGANVHDADLITGANAVDATTVEIHLSEPDVELLQNLARPLGMMSSPTSWTSADVGTNPVGSGPYILDGNATVPGSTYVFHANPNYWDDSFQRFETVTMTVFVDGAALTNALMGGQLDASNFFGDLGALPQLEAAGFNVNTAQLDWFGLMIGDRDGVLVPCLADVRVRQAINYALNRDGLVAAFRHGLGQATTQIFGPSTNAYQAALDARYPFDPARARELLAEANCAEFTMTMAMPAVGDPALAAQVQQMLGDVGINVVVQVLTPGQTIAEMSTGRYPVLMGGLSTTSDFQQAGYTLVQGSPFNFLNTSNPEVEALLHTMQTGDAASASAAGQELNRYIVENAWFAPFYFLDNVILTNDTVRLVMPRVNAAMTGYMISPAN